MFSSRERAEEAVQELLHTGVAEDSIVFLTRAEHEATTQGKQAGATVGGFMGMATGMSAGVVAATLTVTGIGAVFALGFGAAALLGLAGAGTGAALGKAITEGTGGNSPQPTPDEKCSEDVLFFREVLQEGRSLVVVRTESNEAANSASAVLDRMGLGIAGKTPVKMQTSIRHVADIAIVDVQGRITVGEGNVVLRELLRELLEAGDKKIALNLHEVGYVDSSGVGELVKAYTTVRNQGGQLTLVNPSQRVQDLLHLTKLSAVFTVEADEASAIQSLSALPTKAVA